jgi:hypothetical protein
MAAYRTVSRLSQVDAAYIAGLIDGEGTVTLSAIHRGENRRLVVSIANTELPLLEFVRSAVGAGHITSKRTYSAKHTPSFTYQISGRQALALLDQIAPFLHSYKAKRAAMALNEYVRLTPRNGKYSGEASTARRAFEEAFLRVVPAPNSGSQYLKTREP